MIITSLYGMEFKPDVKTQRNYEKKRAAAIELLGKKYLLAEPLTKKENKDEKAGLFTMLNGVKHRISY